MFFFKLVFSTFMMQAIEQETYPVFYTVIGGTWVLPSGYMLSDARVQHSE